MPTERKTIHVVSNSHWDREWGYPFEETRLLLLRFMDELLALLDADPAFHSFTLDSQTLAVEDYLDLRPERRADIERHVRSGRLIVGPWYSLPEEYVVSGESLVRNLVVGHRVAAALGGGSKIGYTPFSYGQTSQMPQIYRGFDIDTIIFYRGINTPRSEFILEGADGSRLLGMRFGCLSRFSYYFYVYRMLRYGMGRDEWWYDWDRGAAPFRLATDRHPRDHYYILDDTRKQWNTERIAEQLRHLVEDESRHFSTSQICCMQGFDSSNPDARETEIVRLCQDLMPEHTIRLSNLAEYMAAMRDEVKDPAVLTGEFRDPGSVGKWTHLYGDIISARTRLKRANHRAEQALQRWAEPWSAAAAMLGAEYLKPALDRAWKLLLQNHPHDTITGAGIDQMEKDSLHRADQIEVICEGVTRRALQEIQARIDNFDLGAKDVVLTVFNPCPFPRRGVISCYLDMPDRMGYEAFRIVAPGAARPQRLQKVEQFRWGALVRNLQDISLELVADRVRCHIEVDEIPALGYRTYHLERAARFEPGDGTLAPAARTLENEHLRVDFHDNGTLSLTHKETGHTFAGLHYLEDSGETGHSWIHQEPQANEVITSHGFPCAIALEEAGPLYARMRVDSVLRIPIGVEDPMTGKDRFEFRPDTRRSGLCRDLTVTSRFTLRAGQRRLEVTTSLDNQCRDHRLRVVLPTGLAAARQTHAEAAFDVIARDIHVREGTPYHGRPNPQYPMHRFVDVSDGTLGLAVLNTGIREYEVADTPERPLAITLLRAFTYRNCPIIGRWEVHPEMELAQCIGPHEWSYAIYPHRGDWTQGVFREAEEFNLPLEAAQAGPHAGTLPKAQSFLELAGDELQLTAVKRAEDRPGSLIVRLFNPLDRDLDGELRLARPIRHAWVVNLNEERRAPLAPAGALLRFPAGRKKIVTLELEF